MDKITQSVIFPELNNKPIHCVFDEPHSSVDGGMVLVKAADAKLGLIGSLSGCVKDTRQAGKVQHTIEDLLGQRVYSICAGYPDTNDAARLRDDPIFKLVLERSPIDGLALPSQASLSRFENLVKERDLIRMARRMATTVIDTQHRRRGGRAKAITIDLDSTDDPTHGQQLLSCFNTHYDTRCYLILLAFITFDGETEPYLLTGVLRSGVASEKAPLVTALLARIVGLLRAAFPQAKLKVRLDGGFACPDLLTYLDGEPNLKYVLGLPKNARLTPKAERMMESARRRVKRSGQSERGYGAGHYQADSWERKRRVIFKAEVTCHPGRTPKDNPRFLVTNMRGTPQEVYADYCGRGEIENRIKELHHGLEIDRNSCHRFEANQLRVLLTVAAYALMQEIRTRAKRTSLAHAQVSTLRERLLKLSVRVTESARRIVFHLPQTFAYLKEWTQIAGRLGAVPG